MFQISITCQTNHEYYNTHFTMAILQCSGDDICYNLEYFIFIDKTTNRKKMKNLHYTLCMHEYHIPYVFKKLVVHNRYRKEHL